MYIVGKVTKVLGDNVAWDPVKVVFFRRTAEAICPTAEFFYLRFWPCRKIQESATPVFPKARKS